MAQLRDFRAAVPLKPLGSRTTDRETDQVMHQALVEGDILSGLANLILWILLLTRLGEITSSTEEGLKSSGELDVGSWFDAAMDGGALGLCADFLFGQTTGLYQLPLLGYAPPRHPSIDSALQVWKRARHGEDSRALLARWAEREGDEQLDTLQATRQALNYALLHHLQNMMEPGYLPRTLKHMQRSNLQLQG